MWWGSTGYRVRNTFMSTPTVTVIGGQRLMIVGSGDGGIHAFKVHTGEKVWSYILALGDVNADPVVKGNLVYAAHGGINPGAGSRQGRVVCLDAGQIADGKPKLVWKKDGLKIKFSSPILHNGRLYLTDEGATLHCLDAAKGDKIWSFKFGGGSNNRGSPVLADGKIYACDAASGFHILEPGPKRCKRLLRWHLSSRTPGVDAELDGSPSVANHLVYFSTNDTTYCLGTPDEKTATGAAANDVPVSPGKPARLQVFPAEGHPGTGRLGDVRGPAVRRQGQLPARGQGEVVARPDARP